MTYAVDGYQCFVLEFSVAVKAAKGACRFLKPMFDLGKAVLTAREHVQDPSEASDFRREQKAGGKSFCRTEERGIEPMKKISLQTVLILIICVCLVPVNVLLLVSSEKGLQSAQKRLEDSYDNETYILEYRMNILAEQVMQELQSGASESWSQLANLGSEGKLSQINLVDQLRYIWQRQELLTGGYLKLNATGEVIVTIDASLADYEEKARVERALSKESLFPKGFGQFTMETEDGALYWVWNVNAQNYSWGVFIPLSEVMRIVRETVPAVGELYLIDEEGRELYNINGSSIKTLEEIADETERVQETLNVAVDSKTKLNQESGKEKETDIRGEEQADIAEKNLYEDLPEKENYIYTVVIEGVDTKIVRAIPRTAVESGIPLAEKSVRNLALLALVIIPVIWISIKRLVLAPLFGLSKGMQEIQKDHIEYRIPESAGRVREFEYLDRSFNDMAEQIGKLRIAKYEAEIEKLDTEATNLRLQVNPHLLLNSLNMICNLAKLEELSTIQSYTMNMAEYFRYVLRRNEELVTLKAEMKFVECFLEMQKVRFPGSFVSVYKIEEGLEDFRIPPMLIQNFVENSIKYGLKMGEEIEILIIARRERVVV